MKYKVKIDEQIFSVEIQDLRTRPVIAIVNGQPVEVWPETEPTISKPARTSPSTIQSSSVSIPVAQQSKSSQPHPTSAGSKLRAPIPGVIVSIAVQSGDEVDLGQELLCIEAMKMKNMIRASHRGVIDKIHIHPGQAVRHQEVLLTYAD